MKILAISNLFLPDHAGGASIYSDLLLELANRGHDVTVRCAYPYFPEWQDKSGDNGIRVERSSLQGVHVERYGLIIPKNPRSVLSRLAYETSFFASLLRSTWRGPKPDVIVAFSTMLSPVAFAATNSTLRRVPLVINVQDFSSTGATAAEMVSQRVGGALGRIEAGLFRSADLLLTISPEMVDSLEHMTGGRVPVRYVPNWLNESQAEAVRALPAKVQSCAGRPLDLLYAGNVGNKQNLSAFCEYLHGTDLDVRLTVHASGPGADALRTWWEDGGERDPRLAFLPFLDEAAFVRRLHECDLFLISERSGSGAAYMPSKLLPAIATGTPVLAVCDAESSLGREMARSELGPVLRWQAMGELARVVEQSREADRYSRWHRAALTRSSDFDRATIIDQFERHLSDAAGTAPPSTSG